MVRIRDGMAIGFESKQIYETKRKREEEENLFSKYLGEEVEMSVRDAGNLTGRIISRVGDKLVIDDGGKIPLFVDYHSIILLNPLLRK